MFGVDSSELLIVAVLALIFIGPKDLPRVMLQVGRWVGKVRGYARHFTSGIENAMREAELEEMDRKWREQNQRILDTHPADGLYPDPVPSGVEGAVMTPLPAPGEPVSVPHPMVEPALPFEAPAAPDPDPRLAADRELP